MKLIYMKQTQTIVVTLFFFQADDGIRYGHVTGVQTCALPIYPRPVGGRQADAKGKRAEPGRRRRWGEPAAAAGLGGTEAAAGRAASGQFGDGDAGDGQNQRSEEHTSELQSRGQLVCRLLLEKK